MFSRQHAYYRLHLSLIFQPVLPTPSWLPFVLPTEKPSWCVAWHSWRKRNLHRHGKQCVLSSSRSGTCYSSNAWFPATKSCNPCTLVQSMSCKFVVALACHQEFALGEPCAAECCRSGVLLASNGNQAWLQGEKQQRKNSINITFYQYY